MTRTLLLVGIVVVLVWPVRVHLTRAKWTALAPRTAIVLWQSIGLSVGIAIFGTCFELASKVPTSAGPRRHLTDTSSVLARPALHSLSPHQLFGYTVGIILATLISGTLLIRAIGLLRARAYHRMLLNLVAEERREVPGALILDHPQATAYSLPGLHSRVVISSGAIDALSSDELAVVLAHERAHTAGHHDLVLFPFETAAHTLPSSRALAEVTEEVRTLLEMAADDSALRKCEPHTLVRALRTLAIEEKSPSARSAMKASVNRRAQRALEPRASARLVAVGSGLSSLGVLALPIVTILATSSGR